MRVHLIKKQVIEGFVERHAGSRKSFETWITVVRYADWESPADISKTFGSADILGNGTDRVVFNVGGNHFRIIAKYFFGQEKIHLYIKWIGTHSQYDELCRKREQYFIDLY
jgi:mRNA interferase HigB